MKPTYLGIILNKGIERHWARLPLMHQRIDSLWGELPGLLLQPLHNHGHDTIFEGVTWKSVVTGPSCVGGWSNIFKCTGQGMSWTLWATWEQFMWMLGCSLLRVMSGPLYASISRNSLVLCGQVPHLKQLHLTVLHLPFAVRWLFCTTPHGRLLLCHECSHWPYSLAALWMGFSFEQSLYKESNLLLHSISLVWLTLKQNIYIGSKWTSVPMRNVNSSRVHLDNVHTQYWSTPFHFV
jgi:hypothetical protein